MAQLEEVNVGPYRHLVSERAVSGETMLLNMGPQHLSTHGVLRLLLELDGEIVVNAIPDIGYLHTGIEKNMEAKTYLKAEVMTDRLDYMNTTGNNLAYVLAVEKLIDLDVPARAQAIRVILQGTAALGDPQWGRLHLVEGLVPSLRTMRIARDPACKGCSAA